MKRICLFLVAVVLLMSGCNSNKSKNPWRGDRFERNCKIDG